MNIKDAKPQVGIFEIVDGVFLKSTEDVQSFSNSGTIFSGNDIHMHATDIPVEVKYSTSISKETKQKFASDNRMYLHYPRGRIDYDVVDKVFYIMSSRKFLEDAANVELVTREFHLPPVATGKVVLQADDGHYAIY